MNRTKHGSRLLTACSLMSIGLHVLDGCTGPAEDQNANAAAHEFYAAVIEEAQAAQASDEQVAVLVEAAAKGELTRADANVQLDHFAACMEAAGGA